MGRTKLLQIAKEYQEAKETAEMKKPADFTYSVDTKWGVIGSAVYKTDRDELVINIGSSVTVPGEAIHALRIILDNLDN